MSREGWYYWFSFLTPNLDNFPRLPALITLTFTSGRADLRERHPEFGCRGGFAGMEMPSPPVSDDPSFIQVDVWVGETGANGAETILQPLPFMNAAELVQEKPERQEAQCHLLELEFPAGERVAIAVTQFSGRIERPMLLRAS